MFCGRFNFLMFYLTFILPRQKNIAILTQYHAPMNANDVTIIITYKKHMEKKELFLH